MQQSRERVTLKARFLIEEKMDLGKLYEKQISLSEWLEDIGYKDAMAFRDEDNEKRERLKVFKEVTGVPFDEPHKFEAVSLKNREENLTKYVEEHGDELCALRLIPKDPSLEKLRIRGKNVRDALAWFDEQKIEAEKYRAEYLPHSDNYQWSSIFVVTDKGIFGEIIADTHAVLTQGIYDKAEPIQFSYNFSEWSFSRPDEGAEKEARDIVKKVLVEDEAQREMLIGTLQSSFVNNYMKGYFETVNSPEFGFWMTDYNRVLGEMLGAAPLPVFSTEDSSVDVALKGQVGSSGRAEGKARVVTEDTLGSAEFEEGDILVCSMTTPSYLPLIKKASAVVTMQGGILSHAAIVCRELKIPCVIGVKNLLTELNDGEKVSIDATKGIISKLA